MKFGIEAELSLILKKRAHIDFKSSNNLCNEKLLSIRIGMQARELILTLFDIERKFRINIPQKYILDGYFDTYNHLVNIVEKELGH